MAFDAVVQPLGVNIISPNPDELQPGQAPEIQVAITIGLMLPFQQAPGQPLMVPLGTIRVPFEPGVAKEIGEKMAEEGGKFPPRPNLDIANSLEGLDQTQAFQQKLRGQ